MTDEQRTAPRIARASSTFHGYREAELTTTPLARAVLITLALVVSMILVYEAHYTLHEGTDHGWFIAVSLAGIFVARGLYLQRPITLPHFAAAVMALALASIGYRASHPAIGFVLLAATGFIMVLPRSSKPQPNQLYRVAELVGRTENDAIAPFALHSSKTYFFNSDSTAAIGYRTRFGFAVVAGDPIGERRAFEQLLTEFSIFAINHGWRVAVLGASPELAQLWRKHAGEHRGLHPIPIGRDVVLDVGEFNLVGRRFRNLRQAVSRTKNSGVTTEMVYESDLTDEQRAELLGIVDEWGRGRQTRGFSMILDHLLDGRNPNMLIVLAKDENGQIAGFQRYGIANRGRELSLDVPWRRKNAPNGLDERMIIDLVDYAEQHDVRKISLAFAPFPEIFAEKEKTRLGKVAYALVHLADPLIRLESLYRFLRKFHALADQRFVLIRWREVVLAAAALLTLEFVPHRREY